VARDVINQAAVRCPESNLFVSGYSQGAMVIRNGLARADESARAKVKVCVLLFVSTGIVCRTNRF
jgi:type IV secretory pathway VirJ component